MGNLVDIATNSDSTIKPRSSKIRKVNIYFLHRTALSYSASKFHSKSARSPAYIQRKRCRLGAVYFAGKIHVLIGCQDSKEASRPFHELLAARCKTRRATCSVGVDCSTWNSPDRILKLTPRSAYSGCLYLSETKKDTIVSFRLPRFVGRLSSGAAPWCSSSSAARPAPPGP